MAAVKGAFYVYVWADRGNAFSEGYGLKDPMRRAAVSIPSNIVEGDELDMDRQAIKFFYTAKGSSAEVLLGPL